MKDVRHIAFIVSGRSFGGCEIRYLRLAYYLFHKGYNVSVLMNSNLFRRGKKDIVNIVLSDKKFKKRVHEIGYPYLFFFQKQVYYLINKLFGYDAVMFFTIKTLRKINADIIYTNKRVSSLKILRDKLNVKIAKEFTSPDTVDNYFKNNHFTLNNYSDIYLFVSQSVEDRFNEKLKNVDKSFDLPKKLTAPIPFFYPIEISEEIDLEKKENIMIYAHRFLDRKNPILFARIVKKMCSDVNFDDWKFCLFGKGKNKSEIIEMLKKEIESGRVEVGYKTNIIEYLKKSKIFFSLIEPDSFPSQSVAEAMYCGNSIVVLNVGKSSFFIDKNGFSVDKNEKLIYLKVKELVRSNCIEKGMRSRDLIEKKLDKKKYIKYFDKIINYLNNK